MKLIYNENTYPKHLDDIKNRRNNAGQKRLIHTTGLGLISVVVTPTVSSFINPLFLRLLVTFALATFLCLLLPRLLFRFLPSCQFPPVPSPKMFFHDCLVRGNVLDVSLNKKRKEYEVVVLIERNGEKEEKRILMKEKRKEGLAETIVDFDEGVVWVPVS